MGNIDSGKISVILAGIENLKRELEALENEVRTLVDAPATTQEVLDIPEENAAAISTEAGQFEEPIDISLSDIDVPVSAGIDTEPETAPADGDAHEAAEVPQQTTVGEVVRNVDGQAAGEAQTAEAVVEESLPMEEDLPVEDDLPMEDDLPVEVPAEVPQKTVEDLPAVENLPAAEPAAIDEPVMIDEPVFAPEPAAEPKSEHHKGKTVMESVKADKAVLDVMAERQAWRIDRPGSPIKNIISAISLNDRVLLINVLFKEDPILFQNTITAFNGMQSLDEAVSYIQENFSEWDLNSESVYRLMMAVRRKLK